MSIADLRFLVVEDHEFQRKVLLRILAGLGAANVSVAADGREALEVVMAPDSTVDIIISDLDMPGMDGAEFMRHLGEAHVPVAIILASALGGLLLASVEATTRDYGVRILGVIEKPLTPAKLAALIDLHAPIQPAPPGAWSLVKSAPAVVVKGLAHGLRRQLDQWSRIAQPAVCVDRSVLAAICDGNAAAEREILADFRRVNDADAAVFTLAVKQCDAGQVTSSSDRISGASKSIGAFALSRATERVERASAIGDWKVAQARMGKFERELGRLNNYCEEANCTSPA